MLVVFVLLGQGCAPQAQDQNQSETPADVDASMEKMEGDDAMMEEDSMEDDSMEKDAMMEDPGASETAPPVTTPTEQYRGFYFDVRYPENFTASPNGPVSDSVVQTDAAQFESPDGRVAFYVYSPLWSDEPDYLKVAANETLVDEKTTETDGGDTITKWVTVKANDGSYHRSYVSIREQVTTGSEVHHVFGIKYADQAAYNEYRDEYLRFKSSLRQYAD